MTEIKITIGREDKNMIVIPEDFNLVSRYHATIIRNVDGSYEFADFSTSGTSINGEMVHNASRIVRHGDEIILAGQCAINWPVIDAIVQQCEPQPQLSGKKTVYRSFDPPMEQTGGKKTVYREYEPPTPESRETRIQEFDAPRESIPKRTVPLQSTVPVQSTTSFGTSSGGYRSGRIWSASEIAKYLRKWNWGAFLLSFVWGCFHKIYWPLIVLAANLVVSVLPLIMQGEELIIAVAVITWIVHLALFVVAVYLGINGSERAWKRGVCDKNFELFKKKQQQWATAGLVCFGIGILLIIIMVIAFIDKV